MSPHPGPPLTKVTINLYADDVALAKRIFGEGWSVEIREIIRAELNRKEPYNGK